MANISSTKCRGCAGGKIECHTPEIALTPGQCLATWLEESGPHHGCVLAQSHDMTCVCRCGRQRYIRTYSETDAARRVTSLTPRQPGDDDDRAVWLTLAEKRILEARAS